MAEGTKIEWADHTFNPWEGCQKVGPGCDHCYAETRNARFNGGTALNWGPGAPRRRTTDANWRKPLQWQAEAKRTGIRSRVFCASLADVFDNAVHPDWRSDLFELIHLTPDLDWLLLTKRIGNVARMIWDDGEMTALPDNVWLGATIVNQEEADRDIPKLLSVPAKVRFLSMEPLLGPVDIRAWMPNCYECGASCGLRLPSMPSVERCTECGEECDETTDPIISEGCPKCAGELEPVCPDCGHYMVYQHPDTPYVDWVIVGGESGVRARSMHPAWARSLRDQSAGAGVPFLFKQWGEWSPSTPERAAGIPRSGWQMLRGHPGVAKAEELYPEKGAAFMARIGKSAAGRLLDGVQHDEVPSRG